MVSPVVHPAVSGTSTPHPCACLSLCARYLSNNNIKSWNELDKLAGLENLKDLLLVGNEIYSGMSVEERRIEVLRHLPQLTKIDGELVTPSERAAAEGGAEED